jgi:Rad3-related DNA helicase
MNNRFSISVRHLVEYVLKSGSINLGFRTSGSLTEGTRLHQKIQKTYKETDEKEFFLSSTLHIDGIDYLIEGRCDGVIFEENGVMIDEIKSTSTSLEKIEEDSYPVHFAQAKVYAYMYSIQHELEEIIVQLTYIHAGSEEIKRFRKSYSQHELRSFVEELLFAYSPYAKILLKNEINRNESIKELSFPFPSYREGQRKLAGAVYKTVSEGKNLFAVAPTGIGKTMSTIFPAVKAFEENTLKKIIYLTARTTTRMVAEEAFSRLEENGLNLNCVTLTAKEKICFKEETLCQKDTCEFANGYFDRINTAVLDILTNETIMSRSVIEEYARKHTVCPFEFSLDLADVSDALICDYNYVYDPHVAIQRFFEEQKKHTVLLVDEAHNLVDRAREMYSASIIKSPFLQLKRIYKNVNTELYTTVKEINNYFIQLKKKCNDEQFTIWNNIDDQLSLLLNEFLNEAEKELQLERLEIDKKDLLETYFEVDRFRKITALYDERFITYFEKTNQDCTLKLFCLDPSKSINRISKKYRSSIFFSATLNPLHYFRDLLGAQEEDYNIILPSPFNQEQFEVNVLPISTKFRDRERTKDRISDKIIQLVKKRSGNYLFFFPSYQYLRTIHELFLDQDISAKIILQEPNMTEEDREQFLAHFQVNNHESTIGFAVMGGIFSEGIDLVGDRLTGVVIIGVGLPQIGLERDIIKDYFNQIGKNGYHYAYVFPGMNKVLQAAGRLIRTEEDSGSILLVDDRYTTPLYQGLFPKEWSHFSVTRE